MMRTTNAANSTTVLPWFDERMMEHGVVWALMMTNGVVIGTRQIETVEQAADGTVWIQVEVLDTSDTKWFGKAGFNSQTSPRLAVSYPCKATINANHIIAALELPDT